jgi:hypothetical protein
VAVNHKVTGSNPVLTVFPFSTKTTNPSATVVVMGQEPVRTDCQNRFHDEVYMCVIAMILE